MNGQPNYLAQLTDRLADGIARLPEECRSRHAAFLRAAQNPDGGFSGREGGSDLYYTGFALRSLAVLSALTADKADKAGGFLKGCLTRQASVVDFFSLLYACLLIQVAGGADVLADSPPDWPERVAGTLESFRTKDGGYGKAAGSASGSTYHTFLVGLCYQLLGRALPDPERLRAFVQTRQREDAGYVEIAPMKRGGTNPTAAAIGVFQLLGDPLPEGVVDFLAGMGSFEGGLKANGRAPAADLLSTFTGAWTLAQLDGLGRLDRESILSFAADCELPDGGFKAGIWDDRPDVEYTFYGLGVLALFAS